MASHIAERAGAEVPPTAPLEGVVDARPIFAFFRDAEPSVPIEVFERVGDLFFLVGDFVFGEFRIVFHNLRGEFFHRHRAVRALRPNRAVRPNVDFGNVADNAGAVLGGVFAEAVVDAPLVPHLRANAGFLGEFGEPTRFVNGAGERFLRVDVFAHLHRGGRLDRVHMVRRADRNGVELVAHFGVHIAVVDVFFRVFELVPFAVEGALVDVADRDDFAVVTGVRNVAAALAADADAGDRDALESRGARLFTEVAGSDQKTGARDRGGLQKIATIRLHNRSFILMRKIRGKGKRRPPTQKRRVAANNRFYFDGFSAKNQARRAVLSNFFQIFSILRSVGAPASRRNVNLGGLGKTLGRNAQKNDAIPIIASFRKTRINFIVALR